MCRIKIKNTIYRIKWISDCYTNSIAITIIKYFILYK